MAVVFLVVEARGQALHLREDANFNLLQAAHLARVLGARGVEVRVRLVIDGGQSVEEYSLLYHLEAQRDEWRRDVSLAADRRRARRELVAALRRLLPFELELDATLAEGVAEELFYAPLLARLGGSGRPRSEIFDGLAALASPSLDLTRWGEVEELARSFAGRPYLELEAELARRTILRHSGCRDVRWLAPPGSTPAAWVGGRFEPLIAADLAAREAPTGVVEATLASRLVGVFTAVPEPLTGGLYFNSPTSCRVDHGRLRLAPRDRFDLLAFEGSQRLSFDALRERVAGAAAGTGALVAPKYPVVPRAVAEDLGREVFDLWGAEAPPSRRRELEVAVVFIEGVTGLVNPQTGGLLARELRRVLPAEVALHSFSARPACRAAVPNLPGVLPLVEDTLAGLGAELFDPPLPADFDPFVGVGQSVLADW